MDYIEKKLFLYNTIIPLIALMVCLSVIIFNTSAILSKIINLTIVLSTAFVLWKLCNIGICRKYLLYTVGKKIDAEITFAGQGEDRYFRKYYAISYFYYDRNNKKHNASFWIYDKWSDKISYEKSSKLEILYLKENPKIQIPFLQKLNQEFNLSH